MSPGGAKCTDGLVEAAWRDPAEFKKYFFERVDFLTEIDFLFDVLVSSMSTFTLIMKPQMSMMPTTLMALLSDPPKICKA